MGDESLVRGPKGRPTPAATVIQVENRQRIRRVTPGEIHKLINAILDRLGCTGEVGVQLVGPAAMARINWDYLRHPGSTDVITFDHGSTPGHLYGECFICVADAVAQSRQWGTTWEQEVGRYVIHAILHLAGYDDRDPAARRLMKRRENTLTQRLVVAPGWRASEGAPRAA